MSRSMAAHTFRSPTSFNSTLSARGLAAFALVALGAAACSSAGAPETNADLGVAPFVNKACPTGRCEITVTCADGKRYSETRALTADTAEKLIIKPDMWQ